MRVMLKIKGILNYGQEAKKSHLETSTLVRSSATKSQMTEKATSTPRAFVCPLVSKKKEKYGPRLACNKCNDLLPNNLNVGPCHRRHHLSFEKILRINTNEKRTFKDVM